MIDPLDAELISLADAAKRLPRVRGGKPVHVATLWRWSRHGLRGVRLMTVKVGGTVCTTPAALRTFCSAVATAGSLRTTPSQALSADDHDRLEAELTAKYRI